MVSGGSGSAAGARPRTGIASSAVADLFGQGDFGVRLEWGRAGARATRPDIAVVVDVLSFTTSVTVAVGRGMQVFPFRWQGAEAHRFADDHDAELAMGRLEPARPGAVPAPSLSPAHLLTCDLVPRLVLPSPNGSTIAAELTHGHSSVVAGCLRNAGAVAEWLSPAAAAGRSIAVIPAGERWDHDDSLRPALEDHLGAGAILSALAALGHDGSFSPEAEAAAELFDASGIRFADRVRNCTSGRELISKGFGEDVEVAIDVDASAAVPILDAGAFTAAD